MTDLHVRGPARVVDFGGLSIEYDDRVLEPRAWTAEQSRWAAELIGTAPPGPVLELCSGAGHIGLLAVTLAPRPLVCVDADAAACEFVRINSSRAGVQVDVREGSMAEALSPEERFAVVIADPPWVSTADVSHYPEDPVAAIDGGQDGLDLIRLCLDVIGHHLAPAGSAILQIGPSQVTSVERLVVRHGSLNAREVRTFERGALLRVDRVSSRQDPAASPSPLTAGQSISGTALRR